MFPLKFCFSFRCCRLPDSTVALSSTVSAFQPTLSDVIRELSLVVEGVDSEMINDEEIKKQVLKIFKEQAVSIGQRVSYNQKQYSVSFIVNGISTEGETNAKMGIVSKKTNMVLNRIGAFTFENVEKEAKSMGMGGLTNTLLVLIKLVVGTPLIRGLENYHVKGILLYGPPGTGKTLIIKNLASILRARKPKIVNGDQLLIRCAGKGKEEINEVFDKAKADYMRYGQSSPIHVIIFDDIHFIAKKRENRRDAEDDRIFYQLLALIDGIRIHKNLLVFGATNRIDLIEPSLLRSDRFDLTLEVGLPTQEGRL